MRDRLHVAVVLAAALLAGCRDAPPAPPKASLAQPVTDPRAEGDAAARRGDWATAAARYAEALKHTPDDLLLRFALGSAYSHLDRQTDTIEQFSWVVQHGEPGRPEVATARQWLMQTGALAAATAVNRTAEKADPSRLPPPAPTTAEAPAGVGSLSGKTAWPGLDRHMPLRIRLRGETEATAKARPRVTIPLGKPFTFSKLRAGTYRLLGEAAGVALWDVPITIEPDKTTTVDLSPSNSPIPAGQFPPAG